MSKRNNGDITINSTQDFTVSGDGTNPAWTAAEWLTIPAVEPKTRKYKTRAKMLWSNKGLYFLFDCEDTVLTCTHADPNVYTEIYKEDVVEIFLWPHEAQGIYFEYEISPLGMELPLIIPNCKGEFHGWTPFLADGKRKIYSGTKIHDGEKSPMSKATHWTAEVFIPFKLLVGFCNCPPPEGTKWRGNLCRIDYDDNIVSYYSLSEGTGNKFHNITEFSTFLFR
ncbi:MAG: carbohydrate-binding family 9-like protein [Spirochaetales bacterium]|nr:carbohydrate-binding family 9-like protein [Spirochaetales bacterium]